MSFPLKIALAQINPTVGDLDGNLQMMRSRVRAAVERGADLVVFPELAVSGYPPEDLLFREGFVERAERQVRELLGLSSQTGIIVGHPRRAGGRLFNSASYLADGRLVCTYDKQLLPNYGVFDEVRYFTPGREPAVVEINGVAAAITICEDIWRPDPARDAVAAGARVIVNINASPWHMGKQDERRSTLKHRCAETGVPIVYLNLVGGQDELVFDGHSMIVDAAGTPVHRSPGFVEDLSVVDLGSAAAAPQEAGESLDRDVYQALVLAIGDYIGKNGFNGAVVGLSGGVDSALTLALAADALGPERVQAVMMPSRYTSEISLQDARACAGNFAVPYHEISIEPAFSAMLDSLRPALADSDGTWAPDITQENIQARCRGMMLMAVSNRQGKLVLATGNKSEMSVGYATLYGDMAGGFSPLKDVSKARVYSLCRYRNADGEVIPRRILERPPSAELAAEQKDEDSLPPYEVLDAVLELYLEDEQSVESIVRAGFDRPTVEDVVRKVDRNEYKRRQAAPGAKVTRRAFGRERRYPITCGYGRSRGSPS